MIDFRRHPYVVYCNGKFHAAFSNLRCAEDTMKHFQMEAMRKEKPPKEWTIGGIELATAPAMKEQNNA